MESEHSRALQRQINQLQSFQLVFTGLAASAAFSSGSLDVSLREVTQTVAEALHVERCCVWRRLESSPAQFRCECRYDLGSTRFSEGCSVDLSDDVQSLCALESGRYLQLRPPARENGCFSGQDRVWMLVPIMDRDRLWGLLACASSEVQRQLDTTEWNFLRHVVALIPRALQAVERSQIYRELQQAKEAAERANRAKAQFLANMSHEIRTPLTAIIGFAESMIHSDQTMEERIEAIHAITRNSKHLQGLISDILDFSKIEAERIEIEHTEVTVLALLEEVMALGNSLARNKGIDFSVHYMFPLPRKIHSDPTRIKQILLNLVGNAVKFTPVPGAVRMIVSMDAEAEQLMLAVQDTGIGIAEDQIARLFDPFTQADGSTTRKFGGTGLGLTISRELAHRLGGDIRVSSSAGLGSLFVATLSTGALDGVELVTEPEASASAEAGGIPVVIRPGQLSGRVLVADDNEDNRRLISLLIRRTGARAVFAENGQEAVEQAQVEEFDLVLMDMQMPVMGGLEATEMLRLTGFDRPVVALTANATESDRSQALEAGCDGFLSKPIDQEAFFSTLRRHLPENAEAGGGRSDSSRTDLEEDPEFQRMREAFHRELPGRTEAIRGAIRDRDWDTVRSLAHQLKGVAATFGIPEATRLAGALEFQVLRKDYGEVQYLFNDLESLCKTVT